MLSKNRLSILLAFFVLVVALWEMWLDEPLYNFYEEIQNKSYSKVNLSEDFRVKLKNCSQGIEEIILNDEKLEVRIIGAQSDGCHLHYEPFELVVSMDRLPFVMSFYDFEHMAKDGSISKLKVEYLIEGLIFGLNDCWANKYSRGVCSADLTKVNGSQIYRNLEVQRRENICKVWAINIIEKGSTLRYVKECNIPEDKVEFILNPYLDLIKAAGISQNENEDTLSASMDIMQKLDDGNFCEERILPSIK